MGRWGDRTSSGARFRAYSVPRRGRALSNKPVVTVADPGREFAFNRTVPLAGTVEWRYQAWYIKGRTRRDQDKPLLNV
jgi:hypothetical protein